MTTRRTNTRTRSPFPTTSLSEGTWLPASLILGVVAVAAAVVVETPWAGNIDIQGEVLADWIDVGSNASTPTQGITAGLGNTTSAGGIRSIVVGYNNATNNSTDAAVFGQSNTLSSAATISLAAGTGNTLHRQGTVTIGGYSEAIGTGSKVIGYDLEAHSAHSLVVGMWNEAPSSGFSSTGWTGTDADHQFVVGVGSSDTDRKNAFVITQSGKVLIPVTQGDIPLYNSAP